MSGDILLKQGRMSQGDYHMFLFNSCIEVTFHSFIYSSFSLMRVLICNHVKYGVLVSRDFFNTKLILLSVLKIID